MSCLNFSRSHLTFVIVSKMYSLESNKVPNGTLVVIEAALPSLDPPDLVVEAGVEEKNDPSPPGVDAKNGTCCLSPVLASVSVDARRVLSGFLWLVALVGLAPAL